MTFPRLKLDTAPAELPVSLQEFKDHERLTGTDEDVLLDAILSDAVDAFDGPNGRLGRALMTQRWRLEFAAPMSGKLRVPLAPVTSIVSASYIDTDGASQVLATADLALYGDDFITWIEPAWAKSWPSARPVPNAYAIVIEAGYASAAAVPRNIRQGILRLAGHWYVMREAMALGFSPGEIPHSIEEIVAQERAVWVA